VKSTGWKKLRDDGGGCVGGLAGRQVRFPCTSHADLNGFINQFNKMEMFRGVLFFYTPR
jgi:hypothetical protein